MTPKDRDALIEVMHESLIDNINYPGGGWRLVCKRMLEAIEASGCFVAPMVATTEMETAYDEQTNHCFYQRAYAAMQSANPYRKE